MDATTDCTDTGTTLHTGKLCLLDSTVVRICRKGILRVHATGQVGLSRLS